MSAHAALGHLPLSASHEQQGPTPAALQDALSAYLGGHVCLTSSGRAGISLLLQEFGLTRYRDVVALPRMISACVLEAVVPHAFPQDSALQAQATAKIVYHQYGIRQAQVPEGIVIEDLCHAFFHADPLWRRGGAMAAVFSLPKFFSTSGMVGGVVTRDASLAGALCERRDASPLRNDAARMKDAATFRDPASAGPNALQHLYADRYLDSRAHGADLAGLSADPAFYAAEAHARRTRAAALFARTPAASLPEGWSAFLADDAPFLWPVFGATDALYEALATLSANGISTGIYQIDVNRDAARPLYRPAMMLPLHAQGWDRIATRARDAITKMSWNDVHS